MSHWNWLIDPLTAKFGEHLVSIVVFGSFARGEAREGSDLDLLIVVEELPDDADRVKLSVDVLRSLRPPEDFPRTLSPVIMTVREVERRPPILLDMVYDSLILLDRDGFMGRVLRELRSKLKEMGAMRVKAGNGWYWVLKPDAKLGEVVEI
ncbi:MAG: nucleotidyltransferase domain-containing protein [Candidatus Korarchaeum sp.]